MPLASLCSLIRKLWWTCIFHWPSNFQWCLMDIKNVTNSAIYWKLPLFEMSMPTPEFLIVLSNFTTKLMHLTSISCVTWNRRWSSELSLIFLVTTDFLNCGCYKGCNIFQSKVIMISSVIPWIVIISRTAGCLKALNNNRQKVVLDY